MDGFLLIVILLSHSDKPNNFILYDYVYAIEINHFYDENAKLVFDQIIFYDDINQIRDWRLFKSNGQIPIYDSKRKIYRSIWCEGKYIRIVDTPLVRESWTQYDVELINRNIYPKEERRELVKPVPKGLLTEE